MTVDLTTYISVDIETDGPTPGRNSMLSLGAVAMTPTGHIINRFEINLHRLQNSEQNAETMKWWLTQPEAWEYCRRNPKPAGIGTQEFVEWVERISPRPICVAYPAGFDFSFLYYYMMSFVGRSPFGFSCLDMKSYACAALGTHYRRTVKKNFPKDWFDPKAKHSHKAVEDAEEQAKMFYKMLVYGTNAAMHYKNRKQ